MGDETPKTNEVKALIRKIRELKDEKEALRRELWRCRGTPSEILGLLFIPYGAMAFILSVLLNYTPWGIRATPITLSLLALTITFATAAVIREFYLIRIHENSQQ